MGGDPTGAILSRVQPPPSLLRITESQAGERAPLLKALIAEARAGAAAALDAGEGGLAICHRVSDALDGLVGTLYPLTVREQGDAPADVALFATGGWGRRETCPYSDLDLLVLSRRPPDDAVRALADAVLYPLWDAALDVGHAVRSLDETIALCVDDLATLTAVVDARLLCGDPALAEELSLGLLRAMVRRGDTNLFIHRLLEERQGRTARFGDSLYLLEPNLKHGQGGLRDLCSGLWAARARWHVRDFTDLVPLGQASARQVAALTSARDFLLRVRTAVHLAAGRRQDQLSFELQEAIAPRFYPDARIREGEARPAVAPAVEELMRRYYLHARAVVREVDRLLERAIIPPHRPPVIRRLDRSFLAFNGQVSAHDPHVFRERPGEVVRLFQVALAERLPVYGHTKELLAELVAAQGELLGADAAARRAFVELLVDLRDGRTPSVLDEMHDLGILAALMPEFAPCTGRVQHDLYHVFTVDQHQLHAVRMLKRIARGELQREHATATAAWARVRRPEALFLGTLLHDVGKPLGKGHAEKGARLAGAVARRLGLSEGDVDHVEFLVREHLTMSHLSQRRDLDDMAMIGNFAARMGDEETLTELYLLTLCDTAMTAPGNLTEWKAQLLDLLYDRTRAYLRRGPDLAGADRGRQVRRRQRRVAEQLGESLDGPLGRWLAGLPDRYAAALPPATIARHVRLARALGERPCAIEVRHHPGRGLSELILVAVDAPGLLAKITGVMHANRLDIAGAQINSRAPTARGEAGLALDVFLVRDRYGRAVPPGDPRWRRVEEDLARVLAGEVAVEEVIAARRERSTLKQRVTPGVPTEVEIDNDVAESFTVIDVYTQDRPGILYAITHTLTDLGLDIFLSKVATEAERVADVFYVRDRETNAKALEPERLAAIREALERALAAVPAES